MCQMILFNALLSFNVVIVLLESKTVKSSWKFGSLALTIYFFQMMVLNKNEPACTLLANSKTFSSCKDSAGKRYWKSEFSLQFDVMNWFESIYICL